MQSPNTTHYAKASAIIVDASRFMRGLLADLLRQLGFATIESAADGASAIALIRIWEPSVVLMDLELPDMPGGDLLKWIRTSPDSPRPATPVIILAAATRRQDVISARDAGATEFLAKPVTIAGLDARLKSALTGRRRFVRSMHYVGPCRRRLRAAYEGPRRRLDDPDAAELMGDPEAMRRALTKEIEALTTLARRIDVGDRAQLQDIVTRCAGAREIARAVGDEALEGAISALLLHVGAPRELDRDLIFAHLAALARLADPEAAPEGARLALTAELRRLGPAPAR